MQVDELLQPFPIKEFHPFPRALLGPGSHELIGPEALKLGFKKTLVMTSGLRGSDIVHKIVESMKYHGLEVVLYDKVESNPKDYNVMDAVSLYQQNDCDSFVSIGGGSSHDACKGARISVAHDGRNVNEFEGFNKCENPKNPPHIAVSTTAGTGSETSWAYVITDTTTDPDNPHKYVAFDDASVATLAIDDPVLLLRLPDRLHRAVRVRRARARLRALRLAAELPAVAGQRPARDQADQREPARGRVEPRTSLAGREGMMYAQYIAAQAFNSGGLGIIHSISHAVSAFYDTHHGLNNAIALPRVWAFNMPVAYQRFADIAEAMGIDTHGMTKVQAAEAALAAAHPAAARRGHPGAVHRRQAGQLLEEPAGPGPDQVLRERPDDHRGRGGRRPDHQPRPRRRLHARATPRSARSRPCARWSTTA